MIIMLINVENSPHQEYSVQLTFREQWTDERLKFDDIQGKWKTRFQAFHKIKSSGCCKQKSVIFKSKRTLEVIPWYLSHKIPTSSWQKIYIVKKDSKSRGCFALEPLSLECVLVKHWNCKRISNAWNQWCNSNISKIFSYLEFIHPVLAKIHTFTYADSYWNYWLLSDHFASLMKPCNLLAFINARSRRLRHKENTIKMWLYLWEACVNPQENC